MLLALPLAVANGYQQYLVDLIMINIVLAVGLNIVKGFAGIGCEPDGGGTPSMTGRKPY